ncbi:hypothetical protein GIB67_025358 [Kingdonia uniflora]|uniref:tRNA (guanine(10)-N(2))-methyltransferase TRMT11 N-terminal domain-containing protein n=1 Tax=Kingdonia uniflora TaxID=39325 RepID=A0A7J7NC33_9MAGN|nr:hypothetical protein GIB67_025358 [Kingdonia uniflora]
MSSLSSVSLSLKLALMATEEVNKLQSLLGGNLKLNLLRNSSEKPKSLWSGRSQIANQSILVKGIYELWGEGSTYEESEAAIKDYPDERKLPYLASGSTFRIIVDSFGKVMSFQEQNERILEFMYIPFKQFIFSPDSSEVKVNVGQLLQGIVRTVDKTRQVVHLSSDPDEVSKCVIKDLKGISMDLLVPGMTVNTRVQSTLENGIMLSFLTYFTGLQVDIFHLQNPVPTTNWKMRRSASTSRASDEVFINSSPASKGSPGGLKVTDLDILPLYNPISEVVDVTNKGGLLVGKTEASNIHGHPNLSSFIIETRRKQKENDNLQQAGNGEVEKLVVNI